MKVEFAESTASFSWVLFNQGCMALLEILCEGRNPIHDQAVSGQIRNVANIEQKRVSVMDEEEMLKRLRLSQDLTTPRPLRLISRLFLTRGFIRFVRWFGPLYFVIFPLFFIGTMVVEGDAPPYVFEIGVAVAAGVMYLFYLLFRNPYADLARRARRESQVAADNRMNPLAGEGLTKE